MVAVLKWPDYLILTGFLVISLTIGLYHSLTGGKQKTTAEFIMANRQLSVLPTSISLLVSFLSAITLLGLTAETYFFGIQYLIFGGIFSTTISVIAVERLIVPWLYPLKLVSMYEYLERRFQSKSVRIFGAVLGIISSVIYMGTAMFAPSAALQSATGLSINISIPLMAFVAMVYTALGGMRAVIWTDVFQFVIMIGGMLTVLIKGLIAVGGLSNMIEVAEREGRFAEWANFSFDPRVRHTVWCLIFGIASAWFSQYGVSQAGVQRFSAVDKLSKARLTILINLLPLVVLVVISCVFGLIALAYYSNAKCDPLANGNISNHNQLLSYFVVDLFSNTPGFSGLFMATLFGAALSTVSSGLSGSAANVWEDILQWKFDKLTESRKTLVNKMLVLVLGAMCTAVAIFCASIPGPVTQIFGVLIGSVGGPSLGIYLIGGISRHTNWKGCLIGGFTGLAFSAWMCIGSLLHGPPLQSLPPVSTDGCKALNHNFTSVLSFNHTELSTLATTTANVYQGYSYENPKDNVAVQPIGDESQPLLQPFYSLSYNWFRVFPMIVTMVVAFLASLITRDRELERKVDDRLLISLRNCFTFGLKETEDMNDDKKNGSIELSQSNGTVI